MEAPNMQIQSFSGKSESRSNSNKTDHNNRIRNDSEENSVESANNGTF